VILMMNVSLMTTLVLIAGVVISAVLIAMPAGPTSNLGATAQSTNATTAANQTGLDIGNVTASDFSATWDSLGEARDAIYDNDTFTAFAAINDADSNVVWAVGQSALRQQILAIRDQLNNAQDAALNQDLGQALKDVNSASVELIKITQQLPQGG
jgi:hypothetical protein